MRKQLASLETQQNSDSKSREGFFAIFVPLYLVILAFFILLNTIANVESDKKKKALGSINKTFYGHDIVDLASETGIYDSIGKEIPAQHYFHVISEVAKDTLDLVEGDIVETGNKMQLKMPLNKVFNQNTYKINTEKRDFLIKIAQQLDKSKDSERVEVELIFGYGDSNKQNPNGKPNDNIYRAGELARTLVEMGALEKNIIVGSRSGPKSLLIMNFYKRDLEKHLQTFN